MASDDADAAAAPVEAKPWASAIMTDTKEAIDKHEQIKAGAVETKIMDDSAWVTEFRELSKATFLRRSPSLIELMRWFSRNVSSNLKDCSKKSSEAAKLKELIKEALLLFAYFQRFAQSPGQDRGNYLELMSDLLAVYVDLELLAEPQCGSGSDVVAARLVSCLLVYLENSMDHVLDTLLKVRSENASHSHILDAIIAKVIKIVPAQPTTDLGYARYLLLYRLWRRCHANNTARKWIDDRAVAALQAAKLPADLLDSLLMRQQQQKQCSGEKPSVRFYLTLELDLYRVCERLLRHRHGEELEDDGERGQRLKSTNTSETNKVNSINNEFSKNSNSVGNKSNSINIPSVNLEIVSNNKVESSSTIINDNGTKSPKKCKLSRISKARLKKQKQAKLNVSIDYIDLTDDVVKIVRKRGNVGWLEKAKGLRMPPRTSLKINTEDESSGRLREQVKLELAKLMTSSPLEPDVASDELPDESALKGEDTEGDKEKIPEERAPASSPGKVVTESVVENVENAAVVEDDCTTRQLVATPSKALSSLGDKVEKKEEEKNSALCSVEVDERSQQQQPKSEENEVTLATSVVVDAPLIVVERAVAESTRIEEKEEDDRLVNSNVTKTDYCPNNKPKVQQEDEEEEEEAAGVAAAAALTSTQVKVAASPCEDKKSYFAHEAENLDGLTLLACISTQLSLANKEADSGAMIKVKSYSSLSSQQDQHQDKDNEADGNVIINRVVGVYPGLQVEVSSADSSSATDTPEQQQQQQQQQQPQITNNNQQPQQEMSYMLDESVQKYLEGNDNAENVILNGETIMLVQKSPNSNVYIINKAGNNTKLGSGEEDTKPPLLAVDSKLGIVLKQEQAPAVVVKTEAPDFADVKTLIGPSSSSSHEEAQVHYGPYPGNYPPCVYQQQPGCWQYYLPAAQTQQPSPAVQEQQLIVHKHVPPNMTTKDFEEQTQIHQQQQQEEQVRMYEKHVESSKLPLKKRLKVHRMHFEGAQLPQVQSIKPAEDISLAYPGTLMLSIAEVPSPVPALELGAVVEVSSSPRPPTTKSRGRRDSTRTSLTLNQNVPNCFQQRKGSGSSSTSSKRKRQAAVPGDEPVINGSMTPTVSPAKKSRKSPSSSCSSSSNNSSKKTRSSKRSVPTVQYIYPELESESSGKHPSATGKRKKKQRNSNGRWTSTMT